MSNINNEKLFDPICQECFDANGICDGCLLKTLDDARDALQDAIRHSKQNRRIILGLVFVLGFLLAFKFFDPVVPGEINNGINYAVTHTDTESRCTTTHTATKIALRPDGLGYIITTNNTKVFIPFANTTIELSFPSEVETVK
jgi:hypothetical protein